MNPQTLPITEFGHIGTHPDFLDGRTRLPEPWENNREWLSRNTGYFFYIFLLSSIESTLFGSVLNYYRILVNQSSL